jgi:hypothetical protein
MPDAARGVPDAARWLAKIQAALTVPAAVE